MKIKVAIDEHGLDPVALENALDQQMQTAKWQQWHPSESRPFRAILYIMPVFHNPTGVCLSAGNIKSFSSACAYVLFII